MIEDDGGVAPIVVDASVGDGKTTIAMRLWCIERPRAIVWMRLDAVDDDPATSALN